jgi:YEATS domain-containing protein 4
MDPSQSNNAVAAVTTSAASVPPGECRLAKTTACLPIVYGSVAFYLGKKADENSTHQWTLYLRGNNNEDLSYCIQKVIFQLHPSFAIPIRELTAPPYEVTERGWGEFEAQIRIIWKDATEKSTVVSALIV